MNEKQTTELKAAMERIQSFNLQCESGEYTDSGEDVELDVIAI